MNWSAIVKELSITLFVSLVMFVPITGLVLKGYDYQTQWHRPLILALLVVIGKVIFLFFRYRPKKTVTTSNRWQFSNTLNQLPLLTQHRQVILWGLFGMMLIMPAVINEYWLTVLISILIYILLGLGLNIVVGLAGLLDLGFVAFYAVGAYGYALGHQYLGLGFWTALPFAMILASCCGAILGFPVLRMHGDYLAIVTLGFGEIIRLVLNNWLEVTGGPNGIAAPAPTLFGLEFAPFASQGGKTLQEVFNIDYQLAYRYAFIYTILLLVVVSCIFFVNRLRYMPIGRAWEALRDNEIACRSLGLNHVTVKLSAFSLGAMIGGLAGVFFAAYQGFINPTSFTFFESALILCIVVLGGGGSTLGVVIAATVITLLPEILREFAGFRIILFGALMVVMMIWRPRGFVSAQRPYFKEEHG